MAGMIKRFRDIMSANINALLDKAEDPEKMVDQYLRDMESDLGKIKAETAAIMADAESARRRQKETEEEISKMVSFAEKALAAGQEEDARRFLEKKADLSSRLASEQAVCVQAEANAAKMREMHDKLTGDIAALNERKNAIKAKVAAAKAQQKMNDLTEKIGNTDYTDGRSAFERMEEKADRMMDEANARASLNETSAREESLEELTAKYESETRTDVDAELAAMKAKLGI